MLRVALVALLFASSAFAQDSTANPLAAAGCGANEIHFDVKTNKKQHPTSQPDAGKALVYVIGAAWSDYVAVHMGTPPTRFGLDGTWGRSERLQILLFLSRGTRRSPLVHQRTIEDRAGGQIFHSGDQLHG